jgi:hypothetical protein
VVSGHCLGIQRPQVLPSLTGGDLGHRHRVAGSRERLVEGLVAVPGPGRLQRRPPLLERRGLVGQLTGELLHPLAALVQGLPTRLRCSIRLQEGAPGRGQPRVRLGCASLGLGQGGRQGGVARPVGGVGRGRAREVIALIAHRGLVTALQQGLAVGQDVLEFTGRGRRLQPTAPRLAQIGDAGVVEQFGGRSARLTGRLRP